VDQPSVKVPLPLLVKFWDPMASLVCEGQYYLVLDHFESGGGLLGDTIYQIGTQKIQTIDEQIIRARPDMRLAVSILRQTQLTALQSRSHVPALVLAAMTLPLYYGSAIVE
jgi:hypothetical protein